MLFEFGSTHQPDQINDRKSKTILAALICRLSSRSAEDPAVQAATGDSATSYDRRMTQSADIW